MERITFAAIKVDKCIIYDRDHVECIRRAIREYGITEPVISIKQGFLTNLHRFISRKEAKSIAIKAKQISPHRANNKTILTSEEFWCKKSGGKYIYDKLVGYVLPNCEENI